ncbi:MAG: Ig-like domain-containing protein [Pseudomonadota bacterium]
MTKTIKDGEFSNTASGGKGSGDITYESNNERVAEVDKKTGRVTITGSGTALITATKAEDEQYASASIQYEIRVSGKQTQEISFSQPGTVTKTITESEFINTASGGDGKGKIT